MKLGIVSDLHCNIDGLERALEIMGPIDGLLCLGDSINEFGFSNEVKHIPFVTPGAFSAALDAYDPTWVAVGNEDARKALEQSAKWERVGQLTRPGGAVFRRRARHAR